MATATFFQEDDILGKAYDTRIMRRLWGFIRPHRRMLLSAIALLVLISVTDLLGPIITAYAIDNYIDPQAATVHHLSRAAREQGTLTMGGLLLLLLLLGFAMRYAQTFTTAVMGQRIMFDLRSALFAHMQDLSLSFFDRNPVGRLMTRITNDVDALNELFTSGSIELIGDIITLSGIVVIMLVANWRWALITFIVIPPLVFVVGYFQNAMRENFRAVRSRIARINANIAEAIAGIQILQLFNREVRSFRTFDVLNRDYLVTTLRSLFFFAVFFPVVTIFASIATGLVLWVGGGSVIQGTATLGGLVLFLQYVDRFFLPVRDMADKYTVFQTAMASSERIFGILDEASTVAEPAHPVALTEPVLGKIEFRDVRFAYAPDEWVIKGISFTIQPGESVAFVGATGAGKTSLISLISRFYDVQEGSILIDGIDVKDVAQRDLRRHIGAVLQDPFIFSGTIASNIRLHDQSITDERVRQAAAYVNAAPFIEQLSGGYEHEVNERGAGLSVGQKQLVAFARRNRCARSGDW